jgi:hypothetical protein
MAGGPSPSLRSQQLLMPWVQAALDKGQEVDISSGVVTRQRGWRGGPGRHHYTLDDGGGGLGGTITHY